MKATIRWIDNVHFQATSGSGHHVHMDGPEDAGGENRGGRPMEMLLIGLGGCASYDVVTILRKNRSDVIDCETEVTAKRVDSVPAVFESIHLHFKVSGRDLVEAKVARAVSLSADKYCSASIMLASAGVAITHDYEVCELVEQTDAAAVPGLKPHAGMRHVALFVDNWDACLTFYTDVMQMRVEWRPDDDNIYLTSGKDNVALHRATSTRERERSPLDHIGFLVDEKDQVDAWHERLANAGSTIRQAPKTHRDGARSFYCDDPDGNLVQIICHPPLVNT